MLHNHPIRKVLLVTAVSGMLSSTTLTASPMPDSAAIHLAGTPLAMSDLPSSPLRTQIAALPSAAQTTALARLSRLHISKQDLRLTSKVAFSSLILCCAPRHRRQNTKRPMPAKQLRARVLVKVKPLRCTASQARPMWFTLILMGIPSVILHGTAVMA